MTVTVERPTAPVASAAEPATAKPAATRPVEDPREQARRALQASLDLRQ